jgi:hypothetical protein
VAEDVFCLRQHVTVALIVASYFSISPHHLLMHNYQPCPFVSFTRAQYTKPMPCMCRVSIHSPKVSHEKAAKGKGEEREGEEGKKNEGKKLVWTRLEFRGSSN